VVTLRAPPVRAQRLLVLLAGIAWVGLYYWIFAAFFPNQYGNLGSDYGYFLPQLLDGEFARIANGAFAIRSPRRSAAAYRNSPTRSRCRSLRRSF